MDSWLRMKNPIIIAVPELLNMLDVSGCIITADAMSCQKVITEKITEKEADYVLGLKENHSAKKLRNILMQRKRNPRTILT